MLLRRTTVALPPDLRARLEKARLICWLCYLLPYSPDFNPIEQAWSKLQRLLRGAKSRVLEPLETRHRPRLVRYHSSQCASFLPPLWLWDTPIMKML